MLFSFSKKGQITMSMDSAVQFRGTVYENGYGLIATKVMRDRKLPKQSKLIYAYICSFAGSDKDGDRTAFPSVSLQCDELGMNEDTYYKWRKPLVDAGYLSIEKRRNGASKFERNLYFIEAVPMPKKIDDTEPKQVKTEDVKPYPNSSGTGEKPYPKKPYPKKPGTVKSGTISNSPITISSTNITDDDDKRTSPPVYKNGIQNVKEDNAVADDPETVINELRAITKDDLPTVSFNAVVRKVTDMYEQNKIGQGNFRSYLMSSLTTRMQDLLERRKQDKANQPKKSYSTKQVRTEVVPEWLEKSKSKKTQATTTLSTNKRDIDIERQQLMAELGQ